MKYILAFSLMCIVPAVSNAAVCSEVSVNVRALNSNGEDRGNFNQFAVAVASVGENEVKTDGSALTICGSENSVSVWVFGGASPAYMQPNAYRVIIKKDGTIVYDKTAEFSGRAYIGGAL